MKTKKAAAKKMAPKKAGKPQARHQPAKRAAPKKAAAKSASRSPSKGKPAARRPPSAGRGGERDQILAALAGHLDITEAEVELRALRELATSVGLGGARPGAAAKGDPAPQPAAAPPPLIGAPAGVLPQRLFLLLDGRGLDGHGLPIEVIESPATVGSGKFCTVWINAPQIETRHLRIAQEGEGWVLADLGTARGTMLGEERVEQRQIRHGDEYRLAGYLRMRTELR